MADPKTLLLEGRSALVTGGGGGIGRAIAERFAAHGASVLVAERHAGRAAETVEAIRSAGGRAEAAVVDVRDAAQVQEMVRAALGAFGGIDVLVNNVGDWLRLAKPFLESSEEDWQALYAINLEHVFRCTHAALPHILERGPGGSVINVSTIEAFRGIPNNAVYSAFNCGVTGFTRSLALEVGPSGVRVNAIAPETTETLQVRPSRWVPEDQKHLIPHWIPLGRFGVPADCAGAALFLASDLASWVTGTTLHVDGGALAAGGFYRAPGTGWTNMPPFRE